MNPPFTKRGIDFLKFGNKGGDKIFFSRKGGVGLKEGLLRKGGDSSLLY